MWYSLFLHWNLESSMDHFKILSLSLRFAPICSFDPSHNRVMLNNRAMFQHGSFFISDHFGSFRMVHFQCVMLKSSFSLCLNPAILWIQMDGQAAEKCPFLFWSTDSTWKGYPDSAMWRGSNHEISGAPFPYAPCISMYGIFTYKTGWFLLGKCW